MAKTEEKRRKFLIWSSDIDYDKDWKQDMELEYPDMTDDQRYQTALELNADYRGDEVINLGSVFRNKYSKEDREVLMLGRLQRWNGPVVATMTRKGIDDTLGYFGMDSASYYVEKSDITGRYEMVGHFGGHDDPMGQTFMHCLLVKEGLSELQRKRMDRIVEDAMEKCGNVTDILRDAYKELRAYTESPANAIAKVYGWQLIRDRDRKADRTDRQKGNEMGSK